MKYRILLLLVLFCAGSTHIFAQNPFETENVEKFRKVYGFDAPSVNSGNDTGTIATHLPISEMLTISPDSFGIYYTYDPALDRLVDLHIKTNDKEKGPGYRIQIYAGSKLEHANESKSDFIESFGDFDLEVYQKWQPPHFLVRVGDFLSRSEAMREMAMIRQVFSDAFVVPDEIILPKYKNKVIVKDDQSDGESDDDSDGSPN